MSLAVTLGNCLTWYFALQWVFLDFLIVTALMASSGKPGTLDDVFGHSKGKATFSETSKVCGWFPTAGSEALGVWGALLS